MTCVVHFGNCHCLDKKNGHWASCSYHYTELKIHTNYMQLSPQCPHCVNKQSDGTLQC
jgi:hypothetical protein